MINECSAFFKIWYICNYI